MTEQTKQALKSFACGTMFQGHPMDDERLYKFISEAYRNENKKIDFDEFKQVIEEKHGRSLNQDQIDDYLRKWYSEYENGIDLIRVYETGSMFND